MTLATAMGVGRAAWAIEARGDPVTTEALAAASGLTAKQVGRAVAILRSERTWRWPDPRRRGDAAERRREALAGRRDAEHEEAARVRVMDMASAIRKKALGHLMVPESRPAVTGPRAKFDRIDFEAWRRLRPAGTCG